MQHESNTPYLRIEAGRPHATFGPPLQIAERLAWHRSLKRGIAAVVGGSIAAMLLVGATVSPLEATVQMERLAVRAEQAERIHPDTAHEIARLMRQPGRDCTQALCSAELQQRNRAARARLAAVLQAKAPEHELGASRKAMAGAAQFTPSF